MSVAKTVAKVESKKQLWLDTFKMMAHRIILTVLSLIIFKGRCGNALDGQVRAPIPTNTASEEESTTPRNNPQGPEKSPRSTIITALKPGDGEDV